MSRTRPSARLARLVLVCTGCLAWSLSCALPPAPQSPVERLDQYLRTHPRVRDAIGLETDHPPAESGIWLYYEHWPREWKSRVEAHFVALWQGNDPGLADPFPLPDPGPLVGSLKIGYRSVELSREVFFAHIAFALWLEVSGGVPWRLEDWSDHELSYLLTSRRFFSAYRTPDNGLYYLVAHRGATENMMHDPRRPFEFLSREPEQGRRLIGASPSETAQRLSSWFHDYLHHNPAGFQRMDFHRLNPLLADRLRRHPVAGFGDLYVASAGCHSASDLFADLLRIVNIPARRVRNELESVSGGQEYHAGLVFDWQGGSGLGRYLLHTDDLYTSSYFKDPAPVPQGADRGVALWEHVWLNPTRFGQLFSYDPRPDVFAHAIWAGQVEYHELGDRLASSAQAVQGTRNREKEEWVEIVMSQRGFSQAEAEACWGAIEASVLAYGEGDKQLGYQRLLDGPDSRHAQWCSRTGKCP